MPVPLCDFPILGHENMHCIRFAGHHDACIGSVETFTTPDFHPVDRPAHYAEGRQHEPIDVILDWELSFCLGNVVKYIARVGRKGDRKQDLEKAMFYLKREIGNESSTRA